MYHTAFVPYSSLHVEYMESRTKHDMHVLHYHDTYEIYLQTAGNATFFQRIPPHTETWRFIPHPAISNALQPKPDVRLLCQICDECLGQGTSNSSHTYRDQPSSGQTGSWPVSPVTGTIRRNGTALSQPSLLSRKRAISFRKASICPCPANFAECAAIYPSRNLSAAGNRHRPCETGDYPCHKLH